ncbi:MAG TPA: FG-GAP-like repeat-containing protein, partial [Myxococcales bacterium]|nr:FG-GAP-like repeat-containing protein [Myxococcales bacterium]
MPILRSFRQCGAFLLMATFASSSALAQAVQVAGNTGAATMDYSFKLPSARGRYQPALALRYNSSDPEVAFGVGWSMPPSYIASPLRAQQTPDGALPVDEYVLVLNGDRRLLIPGPAANTYRPDVSSRFLVATKSTCGTGCIGSWTIQDDIGNSYLFAGAAAGPWWLQEVRDVDDNLTSYTYQDDNGDRLLAAISYNRYNPLDPNYSGPAGSIAGGLFADVVSLAYEPLAKVRYDVTIGGALSARTLRLSTVTVQHQYAAATTPTLTTMYSYALRYDSFSSGNAGSNARQRLASITERGRDGAALPPTNFLYTQTQFSGFGKSSLPQLGRQIPAPLTADATTSLTFTAAQCQNWFGNPAVTTCDYKSVAAWIDVDGDGRPDLVWGDSSGVVWARNLTQAGTMAFAPATLIPGSSGWLSAPNSPSLPVGEKKGLSYFNSSGVEATHYTNERGFDVAISLTKMVDMDGDGLADLVNVGTPCG